MKIAVTGSSGLIGSALVGRLRGDGHTVVPVVRRTPRPGEVRWDPAAGLLNPADLEGVDALVNLAGEGIGDHRWNDEHKQRVVDSRVTGTGLLAETIAGLDPVPAFLTGSAIGYYGNRGDTELTEESGPGTGFLADVCRRWEAAATPAERAGSRVAYLRTGVVLSAHGGALKKQLPLFKLGVGGRIGSGRQFFSWITLNDAVGAIVFVLTAGLSGAVNVTAPEPVTNADFTAAMGRALHRPTVVPVPAAALKVALGSEMASEMVLAGQRVLPAVLQRAGYTFAHPNIDSALRAVFA